MATMVSARASMNPPLCKLCETRHWLDEGHAITAAMDKVREVGAEVLASVLGAGVLRNTKQTVVPTPPDVPTNLSPLGATGEGLSLRCECGKPREGRYKKCSACRKRAYRGRSK